MQKKKYSTLLDANWTKHERFSSKNSDIYRKYISQLMK